MKGWQLIDNLERSCSFGGFLVLFIVCETTNGNSSRFYTYKCMGLLPLPGWGCKVVTPFGPTTSQWLYIFIYHTIARRIWIYKMDIYSPECLRRKKKNTYLGMYLLKWSFLDNVTSACWVRLTAVLLKNLSIRGRRAYCIYIYWLGSNVCLRWWHVVPNEILASFSSGSNRLAARLLVSFPFLFFNLPINVGRLQNWEATLWIMTKNNIF